METFITPPVLFIMFNRPHKAAEVFERIRQVRPKKFFMVVDGAREDHPGEEEKVQQCRAFKDMVDWECDLKVDFAPKNMGCKDRVSSGITWAFEHVDELIILEDDCVPDVTFFRFCRELLDKYRDDNRVFSIAGSNRNDCEPFEESYAFSKRFHCWGWATWKRAWNCFDITMKQWPALKQDRYFKNILRKHDRVDLEREYQKAYEGKVNSWAYIYSLSCFANHALQIVPKVNMVRNTGFDGGAHVFSPTFAHLYVEEPMKFPLIHPEIMSPLNRLFVPPTVPENPAEKAEFLKQCEQKFDEYDSTFKQLLNLKQYHAVIILFKRVLREQIFAHGLTLYHLNYVYYVTLAYFNLGDYEHALAMISVLLTYDSRNVDILILLAKIFIKQQAFEKARELITKLIQLDIMDDAQKSKVFKLANALEKLT